MKPTPPSSNPRSMGGAHSKEMSRAFVKEDAGSRWEAPAAPRAYRVLWTGDDRPEALHETDDLLDALRWLAQRDRPGFELRDRAGTLLATSGLTSDLRA